MDLLSCMNLVLVSVLENSDTIEQRVFGCIFDILWKVWDFGCYKLTVCFIGHYNVYSDPVPQESHQSLILLDEKNVWEFRFRNFHLSGWQAIWFLFDYCAAIQAVHSCYQIVLKLCICKRKNTGCPHLFWVWLGVDNGFYFGESTEHSSAVPFYYIISYCSVLCRGRNVLCWCWTGLCLSMLNTVKSIWRSGSE